MRWIAKGGMDFDGWRPMECDLLMLEEGRCKREGEMMEDGRGKREDVRGCSGGGVAEGRGLP